MKIKKKLVDWKEYRPVDVGAWGEYYLIRNPETWEIKNEWKSCIIPSPLPADMALSP